MMPLDITAASGAMNSKAAGTRNQRVTRLIADVRSSVEMEIRKPGSFRPATARV
jgi:hypothetical protein